MKLRMTAIITAAIFMLLLSSCRSLPSFYLVRDCPPKTGQQEVFRRLGSPVAIFKSKDAFLKSLPVEFVPVDWLVVKDDYEIVYAEYFQEKLKGYSGGHRYWLYEVVAAEKVMAVLMVFNQLQQYEYYFTFDRWKKGLIKKQPYSKLN